MPKQRGKRAKRKKMRASRRLSSRTTICRQPEGSRQSGRDSSDKHDDGDRADKDDSKKGEGNGEKAWREKFAGLRAKLARDQEDLGVMQRELGVLDLQNYSDPMKAMQQELTRDDINKKTSAIDAKAQTDQSRPASH